MNEKQTSLRLDEILVLEGFVSEAQVKEALDYQKEHGGKLGSHLLRFGYIDEAKLLTALEKQFGSESVRLSEINIPDPILRFIPTKVVLARGVIPFDYDPESNLLKVACEDPSDQHLVNELSFVVRGKEVRLYVAAEIALKTAIARYYFSPGDEAVADGPPPLDQLSRPGQTVSEPTPGALSAQLEPTGPPKTTAILLVSDEVEMDQPLTLALEQEGFEVVTVDSADDATDIIGGRQYGTVFIRDSVQGDYIDLIDRLRKISPGTRVRYFESAARLLLDDTAPRDSADLLAKNLDLLTSLLSSKAKLPTNHGGMVGHYVDRLCLQLGLPDKDRLAIANAAYLHDLARFYYGEADGVDGERTLIGLTAKLLDSLNYTPLVIGVLRAMYMDLSGKYTKRLPIEALGGNIVTLVDLFCENVPHSQKVSIDVFDKLKTRIHDLVGRLFLQEVADAFLSMVQEEMLAVQSGDRLCQIMIYSEAADEPTRVEHRLVREGFRVLVQCSTEGIQGLFERSCPDILVLLKRGKAEEVSSFVDALVERGVDILRVPTLLLTDSPSTSELALLLKKGVEDIIPIDDNLDILITKVKKIYSRLELDGFRQVSHPAELDAAVTQQKTSRTNLTAG